MLVQNQVVVRKISNRALESENNSKYSPSHFQKLQMGPYNFFRHIFASVTPILVILEPKFLESLPLSSYAFINTCLLHLIH
jgi:hypothetical protein